MKLPSNRTKIVCTIGPSSDSPQRLEELIGAGMNVARLNFSHGTFEEHRRVIGNIREASRAAGRRVAVLADLPGPKIRVGDIPSGRMDLVPGGELTLTTGPEAGEGPAVPVNYPQLPDLLKPGDPVFLNDGLIELEVLEVLSRRVRCLVRTGGELDSGKGVNLPGVDFAAGAFTDRDRRCLEFALEQGVDAVGQSFVGSAEDVRTLRAAASSLGKAPFVVAKIERARALREIDGILAEADAVMVARGDLGVEVPIERMAVVQKELLTQAALRGRPVIVATQMLDSMTRHPRPTRAEATDAANAVLDGADCVMLSGETAVGRHPVAATVMLAKIAAEAEAYRAAVRPEIPGAPDGEEGKDPRDVIALSVARAAGQVEAAAIFVPTVSGATARSVARFRLPQWVVAVSPHEETCRNLQFSSGVWAEHERNHPESWNAFVRAWVRDHGVGGTTAILTEGPSGRNPAANHRMEMVALGDGGG